MTTKRYSAIFFLVVALLHGVGVMWPQVMDAMGVSKLEVWYRDTYAMLAASDSARAGYDPFIDNPFDLIKERHIYSDWWYGLGEIGLGREHVVLVGSLVVLAFWAAVAWTLPLRSRRELFWSLLICVSPPFWLVINRANPDLLLFALLTLVVAMMISRQQFWRSLAPFPLFIATGLKYYPVLGGVVLLHPGQWRKEHRLRAVFAVLLCGVLVWTLADDVKNYLAVNWVARGQYVFGAGALPMHFGFDPDMAILCGRMIGAIFLGIAWLRPVKDPLPSNIGSKQVLLGGLGAAVLAGNFFLTVGFLYKFIFVVWLLPAFLALALAENRWRLVGKAGLAFAAIVAWTEGIGCLFFPLWSQWLEVADQVLLRKCVSMVAGEAAWGLVLTSVIVMCSWWREGARADEMGAGGKA